MKIELKNIIEKIKTEGVEEADRQAGKIVEDAEKRASQIIAGAESKAKNTLLDAKKETEKLKANGEEAVRQAARNVLLSLKEKIVELFDKIIKKETQKALTTDIIKEMLVKLVGDFAKSKDLAVEVLLNEKDKEELEKSLFAALNQETKKGVSIKASPSIENGFRIGVKGEEIYYDFTDEAIAEAFGLFLNPRIANIIKGDGK